MATGLSLSLAFAAQFPDGSLVTLSTNLSGVSTWPGYRRPSQINDMDVQGGRVAFAGASLGALVLDRNSGGVVRRFAPPTISSTGNDVALAGNVALLGSADAYWFNWGVAALASGALEDEIGFGVASLGELGLSWTLGSRRTNTFIRTYDASSPTGPVLTGQWELVHGYNDNPRDIQLCEVSGTKLAVVRRIATTASSSRHWLDVMSLDPARPIQSATLNLPSTDNQLRVAPDGRFLLLGSQSDEDWIQLYRVELNGNAASFRQLSETSIEDLDFTTPALGNNLMASLVSHPSEEAVVLHDISDPAAPVRLATLPLPVQERLGNPSYLAIEGNRLLFTDRKGAYREADLSDPTQPRWLGESLLTGTTDSLTHNGAWVLADEGISDAVRLLDLGADATAPREVDTVVLEGGAQSVAWVGHMAYVAEAGGSASLAAIDFSEPDQPRIARRPLSGSSFNVATDGTLLLLKSAGLLRLYSLAVPGYPRLLRTYDPTKSSESIWGLTVREGIAHLVLDSSNGAVRPRLVVLDVRDPANPVELATLDIPSPVDPGIGGSLRLEGNLLWMTDTRGAGGVGTPIGEDLVVFDVQTPAQPRLVAVAEHPGGNVLVAGGHLWRGRNGATGDSSDYLTVNPLTVGEGGVTWGDAVAQMRLFNWRSVAGGYAGRRVGTPGIPHRIGDLILLPVGLHGFDIIRADFLPATAPTLVHPPVGRTVAAGRRAVVSATVDGALPLTLQWFKGDRALTNGGAVSGVNSPALVLDPVSPEDAGDYRLKVTNPAGEVTSEPVSLTVVEARPLLLELASAGGTNWKATFSGDPGQVVQLEQSDDLKTWTAVEVSSDAIRAWLTEGEEESSTFSAGSAKARFYRATLVYAP